MLVLTLQSCVGAHGSGSAASRVLNTACECTGYAGAQGCGADVFLSAASDEIEKDIDNFSGPQLSEILWSYTLVCLLTLSMKYVNLSGVSRCRTFGPGGC
jgi:hypothetical protein